MTKIYGLRYTKNSDCENKNQIPTGFIFLASRSLRKKMFFSYEKSATSISDSAVQSSCSCQDRGGRWGGTRYSCMAVVLKTIRPSHRPNAGTEHVGFSQTRRWGGGGSDRQRTGKKFHRRRLYGRGDGGRGGGGDLRFSLS